MGYSRGYMNLWGLAENIMSLLDILFTISALCFYFCIPGFRSPNLFKQGMWDTIDDNDHNNFLTAQTLHPVLICVIMLIIDIRIPFIPENKNKNIHMYCTVQPGHIVHAQTVMESRGHSEIAKHLGSKDLYRYHHQEVTETRNSYVSTIRNS